MKKWIVSLSISVFVSCLGLVYFVVFMGQDRCLDSGGRWLGLAQGCDGGDGYAMKYLMSPLAITIFLAIILGISSALVQLHSIVFNLHHK
ncbi:MAG: hypothetical protein JKY66_04425 [Spongiibacteraceae bacterium]|nr:hypothetical protein [Spongiibacteraceae bacterium]